MGLAKLKRTAAGVCLLVLAVSTVRAQQAAQPSVNKCRDCHSQLGGGPLGEPADKFQADIHARNGLSCASCHGGDAQQDDPQKAMNRAKGFRGKPSRAQIPEWCGRCHSDGSYMRAFNPTLRTDQLAEYKTSVHGKRLRAGDTRVAVCTDCHGAHGILPASSTVSTVHPLQIPQTCGRCHADPSYMKSYGIPNDQLSDYQASVHYAVLKAGDVSAPTCVTCHGNHGATPPGVSSVARVCGTCHVFQQQLFERSPHKALWAAADFPACVTCHSNHRIEHPTDAQIGTTSGTICGKCHAPEDSGAHTAGQLHNALSALDRTVSATGSLLDRAERLGMEVSETRLTMASAREKLIKARVDFHALDATAVETMTDEGVRLARQADRAGQEALAEYAYRRKGLALSVVIIGFVVFTLVLFIRSLERGTPAR